MLKAKAACGFSTKVEVECRTLEEAYEAVAAGADIVMLDNYTGDAFKEAAATLKAKVTKPHPLLLVFNAPFLFYVIYSIYVIPLPRITIVR